MKKLLTLAFLLLFTGCVYAQQVSGVDVLPDTNSADSTAVLNNTLRLNQNAINTIGGYFNTNNALSPASGGTGLNLSSHTTGALWYDDGTTFFKQLADSTSGYVLTANGAGVAPSYQAIPTPPTYALKLISVTSLSGVATSGNIAITSGNTYFIQYNLINFGAGASRKLVLRFNADSGANYQYGATTGATFIRINATDTIGQSSTLGINGDFTVFQLGTSTQKYRVYGRCIFDDADTGALNSSILSIGQWSNSANVTSFSLLTEGGMNMDGTIYLYQVQTTP